MQELQLFTALYTTHVFHVFQPSVYLHIYIHVHIYIIDNMIICCHVLLSCAAVVCSHLCAHTPP